MNCSERIRIIGILIKMENLPEYSKKIGLEDESRFQGNEVKKMRGKQDRRKVIC